jgi:undecaprenyl pyrophosphate phosphatase UppP
MAYNGLLQALSQVVVGAVLPANDVGMAMDYLGLGPVGKSLAALLALVAIPAVALALTRRLLALADAPVRLESARARSAFIFGIATLPALLAIVLIIPFRIPRELLEVLAPPLAVTVIGTVWMQASAWRLRGTRPDGVAPIGSPLYLLAALLALLLLFQLVLRPGIRL